MNIYQSFYQKKTFSLLFIMTSDEVVAQLFMAFNNRSYLKKKSYFLISKYHMIAIVNE
jgi:hypothetical protein